MLKLNIAMSISFRNHAALIHMITAEPLKTPRTLTNSLLHFLDFENLKSVGVYASSQIDLKHLNLSYKDERHEVE